MNVSEMIKNLQEFLDANGDLECWYASDPEGNDHFKMEYTPTKAYVIEGCGISYTNPKGEKICVIN